MVDWQTSSGSGDGTDGAHRLPHRPVPALIARSGAGGQAPPAPQLGRLWIDAHLRSLKGSVPEAPTSAADQAGWHWLSDWGVAPEGSVGGSYWRSHGRLTEALELATGCTQEAEIGHRVGSALNRVEDLSLRPSWWGTGILAAAVLTLRGFPAQGERFWRRYSQGLGVVGAIELDPIQALRREVARGSDSSEPGWLCRVALGAFEGWLRGYRWRPEAFVATDHPTPETFARRYRIPYGTNQREPS